MKEKIKKLLVDLFAGGGGASEGIKWAFKRSVDIAINHDINAIRMHEINNPDTKHYREDVFAVDPKEATQGQEVLFLWASPDCTHFSKAKGGTPVKKSIRSLAWVIVKWAAAVHPEWIMMENVPEFKTWGSLIALRHKGRIVKEIIKQGKTTTFITAEKGESTPKSSHLFRPDPKRAGQTFNQFIGHMEKLGYRAEWRVLDASDYGAATSRQRLYIIFHRDNQPITWPEPTHGDAQGLLPKQPASKHINFSDRGKSIFDRNKPLAEATQKRIARGLDKFTIKSKKPFIVPVGYGERDGQAPRVNDIDSPLGTVVSTTKHNVVSPFFAPIQFNNDVQDVNDPLATICGVRKQELINPNLSPYIMTNTTGHGGKSIEDPLCTQTTGNHHYIVAPHISKYFSGDKQKSNAIDEPLGTVTAIDHNALSNAVLAPYLTECNHGGERESKTLEKPLHTVTQKDTTAFVAPSLFQIGQNGGGDRISNIEDPLKTTCGKNEHCLTGTKLIPFISSKYGDNGAENVRGREIDKPLPTTAATTVHSNLVVPNLIQYHSETNNESARAYGVEAPIGVIDTNPRYGLASANLINYYSTGTALDVENPLPTATTKDRMAVVENHLCVLRNNMDCKSATEPLPTITTSPGRFANIQTFLVKYDDNANLLYWPQVRELLNQYAGYSIGDDEILVIEINGIPYFIGDIEMRMLRPRELYGCQGFPSNYVIDKGADGKPMSTAEQVKKVGNSVCPPMAYILVKTNLSDYACGDMPFSTSQGFREAAAV